MKISEVYISVGSNRGNPKANVNRCIDEIKKTEKITFKNISPYYLTSPMDYFDQPKFVNCCVHLETEMEPAEFLRTMQAIENKIGKGKEFHSGPRKIDIDILLFDDLILINNDLRIPHPRLHQRRFVLVPLMDLNKTLVHPELNQTVEEILNNLPDNPLETVETMAGKK